ncbi:MAG TPA: TolC family outer membrane protein [Sphingomonadaceae bacterium]|nr:TolC family outer membrane protein [Sphingomonadaceae bacterium]
MRLRHLLTSAAAAGLVVTPVKSDTLREALARTYTGNPTIAASRAQVRTLDEGVNVARAQNRLQVSGTGGLNQDLTRTGGGTGRNLSLGVDVSYPLFNGGRVRNAIRAADTRVEAGRAGLRAVEGDVFTEAVGAYMDVIRDRSVVSLNENQVRVLTTNLEATRDRFEVGDLTRTDIAQSEARLALARSQLATAQGRLTGSEQNYGRVIGTPPDALAPPPPLPVLPGTPDQAVSIALANNPDLVSINAQVRAAGLDVQIQRANRLPTVSAIGSGRATNYLGTADEQFAPGASNQQTQTGLGVQARIPIYQGGLVGAQVRQAQSLQSQLLEQGVGLERAIVAQTRSAYATFRAAEDAIRSNEVAVAANTLALEGARLENTVGTRTVLEVLNAEQELLNSQVALVTARRDAYVAGFALLNAMGRAESRDLGLEGGALYDPVANYERVRSRGSDWDQDATPAATSTRTVPEGTPSNLTGPPAPSSNVTGQTN